MSKKGKGHPKPPSGFVSIFQRQCREDIAHWVQRDRKIALRIFTLIEDTMHHQFSGLGKPEPLKHIPGNVWSRRITQENRLVYRVYDNKVDFLQARYHY